MKRNENTDTMVKNLKETIKETEAVVEIRNFHNVQTNLSRKSLEKIILCCFLMTFCNSKVVFVK